MYSLALIFVWLSIALTQSLSKLDDLVKKTLDKYNIKGIAIVAVQGNKDIYKKGFGKANEENEFSNKTRLYIASITKSFIGLAMNNLAYEKKIDLNAPLSTYIKSSYFPDSINVDRIKVKDLLTHAHGLSNDAMTVRTAFTGEYPKNLSELLKFTSYYKGSWSQKFRYSNFSFLLCGIIIENIAGVSWKTYLKTEILEKVKMNDSGTDYNFDPKLEALPYFTHSDKPINTRKSERTMHAAGGLYSTLDDLELWLTLFSDKNQDRLPSPLMNHLFDFRSDPNSKAGPLSMTQYSSGWVIGSVMGNNINFHFGSYGGYQTMVSYNPSNETGIFVFVNEQVGGQRIAAMISTYFYLLMNNDKDADKKISMFNSAIDPVYNKKPQELIPFTFVNIQKLNGFYHSEKYGHLMIDHTPDGFAFTLGKLQGMAYKTENENQLLVQWAEGNQDTFTIEYENDELILNFADADIFRKL